LEYENYIREATRYINSNLDDDILLDDVARAAGFSLSHLYKLFTVVTGFTIKEYIRNRRLAEAARKLTATNMRIIDIAISAGFESQEVFTRAFTKLYGITPAKYRKNRKDFLIFNTIESRARETEEKFGYKRRNVNIKTRVEEKNKMFLVGMDIRTTIGENIEKQIIPNFWQNVFIQRVHEIKNIIEISTTISYEIPDPYTDKLYHLACFEVNTPEAPDGMVLKVVPPQRYAVFTPENPMDPLEYSDLVLFAYGEWLPMSGYELAGNYTFDRATHQ
jgi:AraC family transcriptional regulator